MPHLSFSDLMDPTRLGEDPAPLVMPVVHSFTGPVDLDVAPMTKWAGEPFDGGLGGMINPPTGQSQNYDPHHKPSPYAEIGSEGLAQYGGFVRDEFLVQLQGDNWLKVVREMIDNDAIIGALMFAIQMLVRKVEWRVEPPEAATVEEIVDERIAERMQQLQERQQANQAKMMQAQAGLAGNAPGAPGAGGVPGQPPSMGRAGLATGKGPTPFHQPSQPVPSPSAPNTQAFSGVQKTRFLDRARHMFRKGAQIGGINADAPSATNPTDPETGEPMEFAMGQSLHDITPEARKGLELAVFTETCLHDLNTSWADLLSQIVTFIFFGFAFHEVVYKKRKGFNADAPEFGSRYDDGKIGWSMIAGRAQETRHRWEFDENSHVIGMWQLAPPKFQLRYIPLQKGLLFRTTAYKGNPEGRSVIRPAYRSWFFKKRVEEYEAIGVERDLAGLPIAKVPYEMMSTAATPEQKAALEEIKKIVRNVRRNEQEGLVFPIAYDESGKELYSFELLSSPSRRQFDTDKVITRYEQREAMVVLADFIMLGHDSVGARSLGETKADLFTAALEAFLNIIADVFNTYAIPRLMQMNGEDPALSPKLTFGSLERISLDEIAAFVTALANAGADMFPDTPLEDALREKAGLPPKATSDDL